MIYQLRTSDEELASSNRGEIQVHLNPAYRQGEMARITNQLPLTFEFDAANEDGWSILDFAATDGWRGRAPEVSPRAMKVYPGLLFWLS